MGHVFGGNVFAFLLICVLIPPSAGAALRNYTIAVPDGTTNHGDPDLLCMPPSWTDIFIFYAANYFAHAATVISRPGETTINSAVTIVSALLFPISGVVRGVSAIVSLAKFAKTDLETAARSGALCMVVRTKDWQPAAGDRIAWALLYTPQLTEQGK
ncbi:uncharacterized protein BP5553_00870 [Venustampulla echinocandica]|uniref:Uncharacterized protein n=1 Tax=Venustampulla echinocandica TaxID=2656787 RepID=A0A370TZD2_9HELO|nr:uncharacterized protein BP5553_00870 [Venustampulla echinocandica]RDL40891.1 hypothetical protein BP5553_00870 [Venustampulla echinocandica]